MATETFTGKKFSGIKTYAQIKHLCKVNGLTLNDDDYRRRFMDTIVVEGGGCKVFYNTFNGKFHGSTPDGTQFFSSSTTHEDKPWFQALLSFFYVEGPAPQDAVLLKKAA